MAKKFSEEEQRTANALAKTLAAAVPPEHRSKASGIASGLVRLRRASLTAAEAREVLEKYGAGPDVAAALEHAGVWKRTAEGGYLVSASALAAAAPATAARPAGHGANQRPAGHDAENGPASSTAGQHSSERKPDGRGTGGQTAPDLPAADAPGLTSAGAAGDKRTSSEPSPTPVREGKRADGAPLPATAQNGGSAAAAPAAARGNGKGAQSASGKTGGGDAGGNGGKAAGRKAHAQAGHPRPLSRLNAVRKQTPELTDVRRRIIDLDPRLWINGYLLSTPDAFLDYEPELRALSAALDRSASIGDGSLTLRELSYRVFGDEKFLAIESEGRKLLRFMGVADLLRYRTVGKTEMLHYIPRHRKRPRLVLSENLDPWANMRDALFLQGRTRILGKRVDGAVFGNGHLAMGSHQLADLVATLAAEEVRILYWGDLDRAGLNILARVAQEASGNAEVPVSVKPFVPAYRLMLKRAMKRFPDPLDNKPTDQTEPAGEGLALLEPRLKEKEAAYLRAALDGARLIPQEIVTAADL